MTRLQISAQSIMASTTVLIARTISISAGAGARIVDSTSEEHRRQMSSWISAEQDIDGSGKSCGCLPPPPSFDLPPPPMPPPTFGDFGSMSEGIDWATALTSDPVLESCQKDMDRWTNGGGDDVFIPKWPGDEGEDGSGNGDDFSEFNPETPRFLGFFDQPLAILVVIAAAACVVFLSICLLALYCRKKSSRRTYFGCCMSRNKTAVAYQNRNGFAPSTNGRRRSNGDTKILAVVEGASPATTTTTVLAPRSGYRTGYSDSTEEISDGETDRFLGRSKEHGPTSTAKDWSYNAMRPNGTKGRSSGVNARINNNFHAGPKYGAIPTEPPSFDSAGRPPPMPIMITRTENGKTLTRASPPVVPHSATIDHSSLLYDSHNPIYEEISLHEKSVGPIGTPRRAPRRLSEGVGNYVDSGASSGNSDVNFQFADGEDDEDGGRDENVANEHPDRYYSVDDGVCDPNSLGVINSPCCSSGRSDCEDCCVHDSPPRSHSREACPFSPRPRHRQRQDLGPASSMTPSPIRNKHLTNKISRSTQSGESCLGDEFYSNCCECSGRESGYGTEGRRHPTPQHRIRNRCGDLKPANRNMQTMDLSRDDNDRMRQQNQVLPSPKFFTMRNDRHLDNLHRSPIVPSRQGGVIGSPSGQAHGAGKKNGMQLQAMSSDHMHLNRSAFV